MNDVAPENTISSYPQRMIDGTSAISSSEIGMWNRSRNALGASSPIFFCW